MTLVDKGNGDLLAFIVEAESSKPANVDVGIGEAVTSRGGIEGDFTCI